MTLQELHTRFKIKFDKIDSFSSPELSPEEIDILLNIAQEELIELVCEKGVEKNQKFTDYLKNIIQPFSSSSFTTSGTNKPNGMYVQLPSDYRTSVLEYSEISYLDCNNNSVKKNVPVIPVTRDRYNERIVKDPFNKPDNSVVNRLGSTKISGNEMFELITGTGITLNKYYMDYIKKPNKIQYGSQYNPSSVGFNIDIDCELTDKAQEEIIEIAVVEAFKNLGLIDRYTINKKEEIQENN